MSDAAHSPPELPDDIGALKSMIGAYELRIAVLEEKLRLAQHKRFGASSEKADPDQLGLFNEAESLADAQPAEEPAALADDAITIPAHTRAKGGRKPFPQDLPRERVEHDFAEADKLLSNSTQHCPLGGVQCCPHSSTSSDVHDGRIFSGLIAVGAIAA